MHDVKRKVIPDMGALRELENYRSPTLLLFTSTSKPNGDIICVVCFGRNFDVAGFPGTK